MSITISEAARRWGVGRETIYRRKRDGRLSFATTDPLTVKASEMLRVFGEPKPKPKNAAGRGSIVALTRLEVMCELLKAEGDRLKAELEAVREELRDARADARQERDRLLDLLAAQQKPTESRIVRSPLLPQRTETMTEAEAVLAARQRAESEGHHRDP
jgi:septal ring factor EnvC (AmiA/AmiB activator)